MPFEAAVMVLARNVESAGRVGVIAFAAESTHVFVSVRGGAIPEAESTHAFIPVICACVMLSATARCSATVAALIESFTRSGGAMNVVN